VKWKHNDSGIDTDDEFDRREKVEKSRQRHKDDRKGKDKAAKDAGILLLILIENVQDRIMQSKLFD